MSAAAEQMASGVAYIRLRAGTKGGLGSVLDSGWGRGGDFVYDAEKARRHAAASGNLALLCGRRNGHLGVDVDPRHGGNITLTALEREHGPLPTDCKTETPSGGWHLRFSTDGLDFEVGDDTAGRVLGPGLDVKGVGYLVAPGSETPAGVYRQVSGNVGGPYPEPPGWLVDRLRAAAERRSTATAAPTLAEHRVCCQAGEALAEAALEDILSEVADVAAQPEGESVELSSVRPEGADTDRWDSGLWLLAARAVEVARWAGFDLEDVHERFVAEFEAGAGPRSDFDIEHRWRNGIQAARDWWEGSQHELEDHSVSTISLADFGLTSLAATEAPSAVDDVAAFEQLVTRETDRLRVQEAARRRLRSEEREAQPIPGAVSLADLLDEPDEETAYRVDGLWPSGGRVVLAAPMKSGKTTLTGNLLRSLADGQPFLGHFDVQRADRIVLVDDEMDRRQIRRWLRSQGIRHPERVEVISLRGRVSTFDLLDTARRAEWAAVLAGADVVVLDCLRPVLDALGLSEDKEAGRFLVAFDALLAEAGVGEALVVHHTGHAGERSRGDSRLRDWPDAEWKITRDTDDDHKPRFFRAFGRDVDVPEGRLDFDAASRHLAYAEGEDRASAVDEDSVRALLEFVRDNPEATTNAIKEELAGSRGAATACLDRCRRDYLFVREGPKRAKLHTLSPAGQTWLNERVPNGKLLRSA